MDESQAISRAETYSIRELHTLVRTGRIRVPEFQRSFRWEAKDVLALVDSLLRGFPVGNLLLWKRPAEAGRLRIGALDVDAPEVPDALWVVDGQQRITSLVNAVDPEGGKDRRFALGYSLKTGKVVRLREPEEDLVVPLPDLFDLGRALAWMGEHPEAGDEAGHIQQAVERLGNAAIPATIMSEANESVLREIFDRINNRGKPLNDAEVFDALHGGPGRGLTIEGIRASINAQTNVGLLPEAAVIQALLVRRHTDITRDLHGEFSQSRRRVSDFPSESEGEAYRGTEAALLAAVRFLQEQGVPHWTFLPFRFQLLVLTRFFALFPEPYERNRILLGRWLWRTSVGADQLGISGSQADLRSMAACLVAGEESDSVQRLLAAARLEGEAPLPELSVFRATRSDSKVIASALWSLEPTDLRTGEPMTLEALADLLRSASTPSAALTELVPAEALGEDALPAANRMISGLDRRRVMEYLAAGVGNLESLLLTEEIVGLLQRKEEKRAIELRAALLEEHVRRFVTVRTACGYEDTPPLEDLLRRVGADLAQDIR
ncbi:DUF262 domain-containing protein [Actinomyces slackii]|uniref:Uncharacterized conserved protein n=1 Tax=Actinomyces slackii TaxID=52774 RepID=A0A448KAX8_9ACTO|nr:DUF262 domain-containing protein [Actinomyces slackii]VEG74071.1 Uncharacterized conserved protein [Actinomyces slackii]